MITYPLMTPPGTWSIPRMPGLGTGGKGRQAPLPVKTLMTSQSAARSTPRAFLMKQRACIGFSADGQVSTSPSRGPERRLVAAARLDELLSGAAAVGVGVGHGAAQLPEGQRLRCGLDRWCWRCGLPGWLAFPAVQVVLGGLAGGEEQAAG